MNVGGVKVEFKDILDFIESNKQQYINNELSKNKWLNFWDALANSIEGDVIECESWYGNIVNNGDFAFMWEEEWKPVKLSGEHLGMKWRIKTK